MVWAIGDIHGQYTLLMKLLEKLNIDESKDTVYFVGDFQDRALSKEEQLETIKFYLEKFNNPDSCYKTVLGNHDLHYMECCKELEETGAVEEYYDRYDYHGEDFTKCLLAGVEYSKENEELCNQLYECMLKQPIYYRFNGRDGMDTFVTHSWLWANNGLCGFDHLDDLNVRHSVWDRTEPLLSWGYKDKMIIHGHTTTVSQHATVRGAESGRVWVKNNNINVDCGAFCVSQGYGNLAAYCVDTGECIYAVTEEEHRKLLIEIIEDVRGMCEAELNAEELENLDRQINREVLEQIELRSFGYISVYGEMLRIYMQDRHYLIPKYVKGEYNND